MVAVEVILAVLFGTGSLALFTSWWLHHTTHQGEYKYVRLPEDKS
jgi:hypothetical protein